MTPHFPTPPCVVHEDEHLLVVNKPAGWNTHAPDSHAGEGIYDWLRHREPRWSSLAIIHRLDKETSGLLVFARTRRANQSLAGQFAARQVRKTYRLLTDRTVPAGEFTVRSHLVRAGVRYRSAAGGQSAETVFRVLDSHPRSTLVEAEPRTGRTHQIRVHAAERGFPILGDTLYGGSAAPRVCLHATGLHFAHPDSGAGVSFQAPADFDADPRRQLRAAFIEPEQTDAFRLIHGAADGWPGWHVDRLGDFALSQSNASLTAQQQAALQRWLEVENLRGAYHKRLSRHLRGQSTVELSPEHVLGTAAPARFVVRENGVKFELSFAEGYSVGLFLDQRDNRRRFLAGHVAAEFPPWPGGARGAEVLNTFAYTCSFSVCAARAGARVTSLDLSRKYLDWGRRNFELNNLDAAAHEFVFGDVFDWLKRLAKKGRAFEAVVLDPPTFSQSKAGGRFLAERDYGRLVAAALPVLKPDGLLLASANAARLPPGDFLAAVRGAIERTGRRVEREHYAAQPPDFPITREAPGHLKTVWARIR